MVEKVDVMGLICMILPMNLKSFEKKRGKKDLSS